MSTPATPGRFASVRADADVLLVIAAGGAVGSLARYGLAEAFPHGTDEIAWGTVIANLSGAFLIGVLMVYVVEVWPPSRHVRPFLGVGVLGGYTTFSTYVLDSRGLLASGEPALAAAYLFGTLVAGLLAVWLGIVLTQVALSAAWRALRGGEGDLPIDPDYTRGDDRAGER